jgi:site-specific recombinase XerD
LPAVRHDGAHTDHRCQDRREAARQTPASHIDARTVELKGRGLAESSIRTAYTVLRAVLDTAVRDKAIAQNQAQAVRRPKVTGKEAAYLTPDQVRSLLVAAEGSR